MRTWVHAAAVAVTVAAVVVGLWVASAVPACAGGNCGVKPVKPVTPIGCKDLTARCQCDRNGNNCVWVWDCVPIR